MARADFHATLREGEPFALLQIRIPSLARQVRISNVLFLLKARADLKLMRLQQNRCLRFGLTCNRFSFGCNSYHHQIVKEHCKRNLPPIRFPASPKSQTAQPFEPYAAGKFSSQVIV